MVRVAPVKQTSKDTEMPYPAQLPGYHLRLHFCQDWMWKQHESVAEHHIKAETGTKTPRESQLSAMMQRHKEEAHVPSSCLHFFPTPLFTHSSPGADHKSPKSLPILSPFTFLLYPIYTAAPSHPQPSCFPCAACTPLQGPPADDSIWQLRSGGEGARFAPKQRNIISAKVISTLSKTSQSHPPFECKGLAHSSAEGGRERKGKAKEKAWGGLLGGQ